MRHLPDGAWRDRPALTFAVHRELAECAYLVGRHDRAERTVEVALARAPSRVALADLYSLRVLAATVAGDWASALRWGREGLAVFGLAWPTDNLVQATEAEAAEVTQAFAQSRFADLLQAPQVADEEVRASMRLLSILGPPAYFSGADVLPFLVTRAAKLSLAHGPSAYSAYAYVFHAAFHNARTGEYEVGYAIGELARGLARRFANRAEESRMLEVFGLVVHPWKAPLRDSLPLLREGYQAGIESGELAYAAFNLNSLLINGLPAGAPLSDLLADADAALDFATRHRNRTSSEMALPFRQLARFLMGEIASFTGPDDGFDEARFLKDAQGNQTALGFYWTAKIQAAYLMGDHAAARRCAAETVQLVALGNLGMITEAEHVVYHALATAADAGPDTGHQPVEADTLHSLHGRLAAWAAHAPQTFAHKAALIGAEIARRAGAVSEAMRLYREAIDGAARHAFIQDEAIAHELRGRFLLSQQEPDLACVHLRFAHDRYLRWGALAKGRALESEFPQLQPQLASRGKVPLDALGLIRASQAISAERDPERLFERILKLTAELAGAQSGALILREGEALVVRGRVEASARAPVSGADTPVEEAADLPATILRLVLRSKESVVLSRPADGGPFAADPAIRQGKPLSLLCVPLVRQAEVVGLLYLENRQIAEAFTAESVEVTQVLASQAAISIENSALVRSLAELTGALEYRVAERTRQLADEVAARDRAESALLQAQKMEAMGQLTGGVAHDFNNLLTPIVGSLDMLQRRGVGTEREQRLIAGAVESAERAKTLVQRLLAFARRQPLQSTAVDVAQLVSGMSGLIGSTLGPQIALELGSEAGLPPARADANQLEMALLNLSVNARDAMPAGGALRIAARKASTTEANHALGLRPGDYVRLSVEDTGVGMDEATLARAVEPFFSTKGVGKGTGLGLSMAHGLASQLGGGLHITSQRGIGTTVELWLPVSEGPADAQSASVQLPPPAMASGVVLLVDDEDLVRTSTADMLSELGYVVTEATSGEQALRLIRGGLKPDLLVTDHLMPGMTGSDLARIVRSEVPDTRILLVSGYAESDGVGSELHRLTKPFRADELAASLATLSAKA